MNGSLPVKTFRRLKDVTDIDQKTRHMSIPDVCRFSFHGYGYVTDGNTDSIQNWTSIHERWDDHCLIDGTNGC